MLAEAQLPHAETRSPQGPQQLVAVVLQGLEPGSRGRSNGQHTALEVQGAAMGGQLLPYDAGPGLPEPSELAFPFPSVA